MASAPAIASPDRAVIAWQAPQASERGERAVTIEQRLGRSLDDVLVGITVAVFRIAAGHPRIDLRAVTVANDVRTLTSTRCDELADAWP